MRTPFTATGLGVLILFAGCQREQQESPPQVEFRQPITAASGEDVPHVEPRAIGAELPPEVDGNADAAGDSSSLDYASPRHAVLHVTLQELLLDLKARQETDATRRAALQEKISGLHDQRISIYQRSNKEP